MKKIYFLLALGVLGATLSAVPAKSSAAVNSVAAVAESSDVLEVTYNNNSSINYAQYTGTLADGTVLGFYRSGSSVYFCGAITSATALVVPEKILYNGTEYEVGCFGTYYSGENIDFEEAPNVTSLTLPSVLTYIYNNVPSSVSELHLLGTTPPSIYSSGYISSTTVYVPKSAYTTYQNYCNNGTNGWSTSIDLKPEGWEPQSYTVTVNTPGTFGNILLQTVEQWTDVDELTVIGHLNEDDLKLLSRLKQMTKLDLSQTDITVMTGCSGLSKLQKVLLPSTVIEIGSSAFSGCSRLKEINAPNATSIGSYAFSGCSSLATVSLPAATEIGSYAFLSCSSLTTVSLPAATEIGYSAFSSCSSLTTVSLPAATEIGVEAFYYCSNLTTVSLPAATEIGVEAFYYCSRLTTVSLPAATEIGSEAFYQCSSLTTVSLPAATEIGSHAFSSCSSLTTVSLPAATEIGSEAFYQCSSLTTVSLPACLTSLGDWAFMDCSKLTDVYCRAVVPLVTSAFSDSGSSATLHVPAFSVTSYMLSGSWYSFYKIVALDETLTDLTINQAFTITSYEGLADKIDLTLTQAGHLTVSATSTLNLGTFTQSQTASANNGCSTLITSNEMKADNIDLHLQLRPNCWNFISLPFDVNVSDIEYPEGTLWVIRKYSGADRAALTGNTWQNMTNGTVLQAGEGYILHCAKEQANMVEFVFHAVDNAKKNNIFAYQDVVKPLATYASEHAHNRSWNLVGNPYPAYFDSHSIEHNGVITVYGNSSSWSSSYGYTAYSLLDDNYVLRPNEAFFVQCPADATSMTFKAEGRMHNYNTNGGSSATRAPRRNAAVNSNRHVYNFTLTNGDFTDRTRLVINPDAKMDYEISCDASKFMSDNLTVSQLYVYDNGIRYAIDERPLGDGIINLGARFGQTGDYIIALKNAPTDGEAILLTDHETGNKVNLAESDYAFTAQAGTDESRFTLQIGNEATGIQTIDNSQPTIDSPVYDLQGRKTTSQQKGIYIIKANGKSRKVLK